MEGECSPCALLSLPPLGEGLSHIRCLYVITWYVVISEPSSVILQNGSSQHLVCKGGLSVFLGGCHMHVPNVPSPPCQALTCFPLFPGLWMKVDFFAVEG